MPRPARPRSRAHAEADAHAHASEPAAAGSRAAELVTTLFLFIAMLLSWLAFVDVGFAHHDSRVTLFPWIVSGDLKIDWALRIDTLDRGDAGGRHHHLGLRPPLFDRLHGGGSRTGRVSSPISRCSPSPC